MFRLSSLALLLITSLWLIAANSHPPVELTATHMRVNALIGKHNTSRIQCWKIEPPFSVSTQQETIGSKTQMLGDVKGASVMFLNSTSSTIDGAHPAPIARFVMVLSGNGIITLPTTGQQLHVPQGVIFIANDTAEVSASGHITEWEPGSVIATFPFANGTIPHKVVNDGHCSKRY